MGQAAQTTASNASAANGIESSARFLAEVESLWTLLRVYGTEHPAFRRCAAAGAAALARQVSVSISPKGFTVGKSTLDDPTLVTFARRLRSMGLVGVVVEPGLTPAEVTALVLALDEADRSHLFGAVVVEKIAAASGRRVAAIPLRLAGLRLMEGVGEDPGAGENQSSVWRDLFSAACTGGPGANPGELAESFEVALKSVASPEQWDAMVGVWVKQLSAADPGAPAPDGAAPITIRSHGSGTGGAASETTGAGSDEALDSAAAFLGALSPHLSQRLLAETFHGQAAPQRVLDSLANRLPKGVVLGALAAVDHTNGRPSSAALALLRKMAANVPGAGAASQSSPRTTAELAEIAGSLNRLLGSDQEGTFVPEGYLNQRHELSGRSLAPATSHQIAYPGHSETSHHAAGLAFQILSTPDTNTADLGSALAYVRTKTGDWIKAGDFALAAEGLAMAKALTTHWDRTVSKVALDLVSHAVSAEDLVEGARRSTTLPAAAEEIAQLLRGLDGAALARALAELKPSPGGGYEVILNGFRNVVPSLTEDHAQALCKSFKDATPPPALLYVISNLSPADATKFVERIAPHAAAATRRAVVHAIFRNDFRWPLPLTEQLLKDDEPEIRRLAVMKLVSDADLSTAARVFQQAINRRGPFEPDVALGLAELLRRHRNNPDVRDAFRKWLWSGRRWAALFALSLVDRRRAA